MSKENIGNQQPRVPTRKPVQKRAMATFEAILQATEELISREGYNGLTTNRIAEYAGVSIGSLYHYFPNREAIVNSLYEDTVTKVARQIRDNLFNHVDEQFDQSLPHLIEYILSLHEEHELVLIQLLEEVPELRKTSHNLSLETLVHSASRVYISQHHASTDPAEIETCVYLVNSTFLENVKKYVLTKPKHIPRDAFVKHLEEMLKFYLQHYSYSSSKGIIQAQ